MKDLYSFHKDVEDLKDYYEKSKAAYTKIFKRCGLDAIIAQASGGDFTDDYSHEFQVATPNGEDVIFHCPACAFAQNKEVAKVKAGDKCPDCGKKIAEVKSIEVGNIFDLGIKFSKDFDVKYTDEDGQEKLVVIGCYGIGVSRLMGSIVEVCHDERGIIWPEEAAPFTHHLLTFSDDKEVLAKSKKVYKQLTDEGLDVLWDERAEASNGEKMADSDLIGIPHRLIISPKTGDKIEYKNRKNKESKNIDIKDVPR